jgi:hypothetical protein
MSFTFQDCSWKRNNFVNTPAGESLARGGQCRARAAHVSLFSRTSSLTEYKKTPGWHRAFQMNFDFRISIFAFRFLL